MDKELKIWKFLEKKWLGILKKSEFGKIGMVAQDHFSSRLVSSTYIYIYIYTVT